MRIRIEGEPRTPASCGGKNQKTMEEQRFCGKALEGLSSSELAICGGVAAEFSLSNIISIIRKVMDFLDDYIPHLLKGFKDGFGIGSSDNS